MTSDTALLRATRHQSLFHWGIGWSALSSLQGLLAERPEIGRQALARGAMFIAVEIEWNPTENVPLDASIYTSFQEAAARIPPNSPTPLFFAGLTFAEAFKLRGLQMSAPCGHFVGTFGGGIGGAVFVSNLDDTVIGSECWDEAESFARRTMDQLLGPGDWPPASQMEVPKKASAIRQVHTDGPRPWWRFWR